MRFNTLFFLLVLSCLCFALAQVSYDDCCLKYVKELRHKAQRHAVKYREQKPDGGCNLHAIIFTMRRGRQFCTNPREKWVEKLKKKIDAWNLAKVANDKYKTGKEHHQQYSN